MNDFLDDTLSTATADVGLGIADHVQERHSTASPQALESRLLASADWITNHLQFFSAKFGADPGELNVKGLGELALTYAWMHRWSGRLESISAPINAALNRWRAFVAQECENAMFAELPRKRPAQGCFLLFAYLCLRSTGYRWSYHEETLRRMHRRGFPAASEALPYRVLDREYILWMSGWLEREPPWRSLYRRTCMGRARTAFYLDYVSAYSVTHTIFYMTDFGHRPPSFAEKELARIQDLVEYLLIHYWRLGNWDLVGELLINLECLGVAADSSIYAECSTAFQSVWLDDGALPPDAANPGVAKHSHSPLEAAALFKRHYHTTLVGALYCTMALSRARS